MIMENITLSIRVPIVIAVLVYSIGAAQAQGIEVSAGQRSLALPFQLASPSDHLFGDWYGTRTWLDDRGIDPTLTFVTDSLGNPTGGTKQGFTTANNLGLTTIIMVRISR